MKGITPNSITRSWSLQTNLITRKQDILFSRVRRYSNRPSPLRWSYTHGTTREPLRGITIGKLLQSQVEKTPDKEAVVFYNTGQRLTFTQLLEQSDRLAAGLLSLGLQKGDRVGIWGPNSLEWILTQYAAARAGLILVNINPSYKKDELAYAMNLVQCKAIVAAEKDGLRDYLDTLSHLIPELDSQTPGNTKSHLLPSLQHVIIMGQKHHYGTFRLCDILDAGSDVQMNEVRNIQDKIQFDNPVNIQFTSGTTGYPKAATLSHHNVVNNSYFLGLNLDYHKRPTRICVPVPLYHCFGCVMGSLQMVNHGSTCVFTGPAINAKTTLSAVSEERCTSLYGVPTMFIDILNLPDFEKYDVTSLYTGVIGGAPCPIKIMRELIEKMHLREITVSYGSTETSPTTFQTLRDDVIEKRISTVGRVYSHVEAKIVDREGEILPVGSTGELCTRGYTTMLGYWGDASKTADVIKPDGWYWTGDLAVMDEEGFVAITGREKDMLIRGGENIYPLEIEQILYAHSKVKDVQVVGVHDDRLGEEVCAWVRLKEAETLTEADIRDFCREKLANFKIPKYVYFVEEFPMTVTGKIQKFKLRELAEQMQVEEEASWLRLKRLTG